MHHHLQPGEKGTNLMRLLPLFDIKLTLNLINSYLSPSLWSDNVNTEIKSVTVILCKI